MHIHIYIIIHSEPCCNRSFAGTAPDFSEGAIYFVLEGGRNVIKMWEYNYHDRLYAGNTSRKQVRPPLAALNEVRNRGI